MNDKLRQFAFEMLGGEEQVRQELLKRKLAIFPKGGTLGAFLEHAKAEDFRQILDEMPVMEFAELFVGVASKRRTKAQIRHDILGALPGSSEEIAKAASVRLSTADAQLKDLHEQGIVEVQGPDDASIYAKAQ